MNVLDCGGAGFIGSHLTKQLLDRGDTVAILDNLGTGNFENIQPFVRNPHYSFAIDDLSNALVLDRLASKAGCDRASGGSGWRTTSRRTGRPRRSRT